MKIKNFSYYNINDENLKKAETEVNSFTQSHDVIDIKVSSLCNQFGSAIIYTIIYEGEE